MNFKKLALSCSPLFLAAGCATPNVNHTLSDECLHEATIEGEDGPQTTIAFDEDCGKHKVELAETRIRVEAEEARATIAAERNLQAWRALAIVAANEVRDPNKDDEFTQMLLAALTHDNTEISILAEQARIEAGVSYEDLESKKRQMDRLRALEEQACTINEAGEFIC